MSDLQLRYKKALEFVKNSPAGEVEMSNQLKLQFYAIFKQATDGECKGKEKQIKAKQRLIIIIIFILFKYFSGINELS